MDARRRAQAGFPGWMNAAAWNPGSAWSDRLKSLSINGLRYKCGSI
jgi:hypothetical protein